VTVRKSWEQYQTPKASQNALVFIEEVSLHDKPAELPLGADESKQGGVMGEELTREPHT
jgi:hypothetical protein